jgi:hypothetical protein
VRGSSTRIGPIATSSDFRDLKQRSAHKMADAGSRAPEPIRTIIHGSYDWAAAAAFAFFRSSLGLGRRLPKVPRKILPRLDRRSPLPMRSSPKKHANDFSNMLEFPVLSD